MRLISKTFSYGMLHIAVATSVAFVLTGNLVIAFGIGLIEPLVQTLVFPLHEWLWERKSLKNIKLDSCLVNHVPQKV